jgi:arylsulfatase A-like enzyme
MFDNTNFPWANDLSTDIPTVGDMLRSQGYYTAYIVAMNDLLNLLIESEIGEDVG